MTRKFRDLGNSGTNLGAWVSKIAGLHGKCSAVGWAYRG
jgi:hypothetical protein